MSTEAFSKDFVESDVLIRGGAWVTLRFRKAFVGGGMLFRNFSSVSQLST